MPSLSIYAKKNIALKFRIHSHACLLHSNCFQVLVCFSFSFVSLALSLSRSMYVITPWPFLYWYATHARFFCFYHNIFLRLLDCPIYEEFIAVSIVVILCSNIFVTMNAHTKNIPSRKRMEIDTGTWFQNIILLFFWGEFCASFIWFVNKHKSKQYLLGFILCVCVLRTFSVVAQSIHHIALSMTHLNSGILSFLLEWLHNASLHI